MRAIAPELIDIVGEGGRLTLRNPARQTIERHLGQNAARLHSGGRRIKVVHRAQRDPLMLATPPDPHEPTAPPGWPDPQAESSKLGIPDRIVPRRGRQLPARQMTIKIGPIPGREPLGDHMAIIRPQFALQNSGILRNFGNQTAIGSSQLAPRLELVLD